MTHEERNTIFALLVNVLVNGYIIIKLLGLSSAGAFAGPDALQVFARTVLWVIPISIVATLVFTVLGNILIAIILREPKPDFTVDERDKQFQMRAMGATLFGAAAGFIIALIGLAFGWSALTAFLVLYFSFAGGDFFGNIVKFLSYRCGG